MSEDNLADVEFLHLNRSGYTVVVANFWVVEVGLEWEDLNGMEMLGETGSLVPSQVPLRFHWECKLEAVVQR